MTDPAWGPWDGAAARAVSDWDRGAAPFPVFSENTRINSLYLNRDGMVYIDLNRAFVDDMNAGSGVEALPIVVAELARAGLALRAHPRSAAVCRRLHGVCPSLPAVTRFAGKLEAGDLENPKAPGAPAGSAAERARGGGLSPGGSTCCREIVWPSWSMRVRTASKPAVIRRSCSASLTGRASLTTFSKVSSKPESSVRGSVSTPPRARWWPP